MKGVEKKSEKEQSHGLTTEEIFWETEVSSNIMLAYGMLGVCALLLIVWCIYMFEPGYDLWYITGMFLGNAAIFAPIAIYSLHVRGRKRWLKVVMMILVIIGMSMLHIYFSYAVVMLMIIPVVLSIRYYSARFTTATAIVTGALFTVTLLASILIPGLQEITEYDLNYLTFPIGTTMTVSRSEWLYDAVMDAGLDRAILLRNMMGLYLIPKLMQFALLSSFCVVLAYHGHNLVLKEAQDAAERAGIETELSLAAEIQLSELPCVFPAFPEHEDLDIYATIFPAKEVGGDFYDFFSIDADHIGLVMADVSGKGVPAALFMMTGKTLIRNCAQALPSPATVLTLVNEKLCENNTANLFITAWVGILEVSTGKLTYANAGHCRPLRFRRGGDFQPMDEIHGLALACFEDTEYTQSEVQLSAGDVLYLYTDGVTEATNASLELYGTERITALLNEHAETPAQELLPLVKQDIDRFVGKAPQFDDITMLVLRIMDGRDRPD